MMIGYAKNLRVSVTIMISTNQDGPWLHNGLQLIQNLSNQFIWGIKIKLMILANEFTSLLWIADSLNYVHKQFVTPTP